MDYETRRSALSNRTKIKIFYLHPSKKMDFEVQYKTGASAAMENSWKYK